MKLFKDVTDPIPPHEVEVRLMIQGHCGIAICPLDKELTAFFGTPNGVAKYRDRLPKYTVRSPIYSKNLKVGTDVIVVYNDTLMNPLYDLIHHYACILAHTEVTYIHTAVMARIPNGAPVAKSEIQKTSFGQFFKSLFNGKFGFVADPGDMGIEYAGAHTNITQGVVDLWTARQRILADFLADIGIRPDSISARIPFPTKQTQIRRRSWLILRICWKHARKASTELINASVLIGACS